MNFIQLIFFPLRIYISFIVLEYFTLSSSLDVRKEVLQSREPRNTGRNQRVMEIFICLIESFTCHCIALIFISLLIFSFIFFVRSHLMFFLSSHFLQHGRSDSYRVATLPKIRDDNKTADGMYKVFTAWLPVRGGSPFLCYAGNFRRRLLHRRRIFQSCPRFYRNRSLSLRESSESCRVASPLWFLFLDVLN